MARIYLFKASWIHHLSFGGLVDLGRPALLLELADPVVLGVEHVLKVEPRRLPNGDVRLLFAPQLRHERGHEGRRLRLLGLFHELLRLRPLLVRPRLDGSEHLNEVHGAYMLSLSSRRVFFSGISKRVWRLSSVSLRCPLGRFTGCLLY